MTSTACAPSTGWFDRLTTSGCLFSFIPSTALRTGSGQAGGGGLGDEVGGGGLEGGEGAAAGAEGEGIEGGVGDGGDERRGLAVDGEADAHYGAGGREGLDGGGQAIAGAADGGVVWGEEGDLLGADAEEGAVGGGLGDDIEQVIADAVGGEAADGAHERRGPDVLHPHEGGHLLIDGGGEEIGGRADLAEAAGEHDYDAIGEAEGFIAVVGDEDGSDAGVADDGGEVIDESGAGGGVEGGEGLVEEQQFRLQGEGASEGDALGLAAREIAGVAIGEVIDAEAGQPAQRPLPPPGAGHLVQRQGGLQVLADGGAQEERILEGRGHAAASGEHIVAHGEAVEAEIAAEGREQQLQEGE